VVALAAYRKTASVNFFLYGLPQKALALWR
jgi:hypothetical protein